MELLVSNLPLEMQEEELWDLFEMYGIIEYAEILHDEATGASRGFGFVGINDEGEASRAIAALHKSKCKGSVLKVKEAFDSEDEQKGKYYKKQLSRKEKQRNINVSIEDL